MLSQWSKNWEVSLVFGHTAQSRLIVVAGAHHWRPVCCLARSFDLSVRGWYHCPASEPLASSGERTACRVARIIVSPLSWGLGHITRDAPLVDFLRAKGHEVVFIATGRALAYAQRRWPECRSIELADMPPPYSKSRFFLPQFIRSIPRMLKAIKVEHEEALRIFAEVKPDLIFSDNRYGIYSPEVPSFILSHQIRLKVPRWAAPIEVFTEAWARGHLKHFTRVIVPDYDGEKILSGRLSHHLHFWREGELYYAGQLSTIRSMNVPQDIAVFISISGPEPQRALLEQIVRRQAPAIEGLGKIVVTLGRPEASGTEKLGRDIDCFSFLPSERQQEMMNRARIVVSRSGYTTVMELAELGRRALYIPTPGQTEQEYLSRFYRREGLFYSASQFKLDLARDLERAAAFPGFQAPRTTQENVQRLYDELLAPRL